MEHDFLGRSSGKFPGATEHLKRRSCFFVYCFFSFPDKMFQTEIRLPFAKTHI